MIKFEHKAHRSQGIDKWAQHILAQPGMKYLFKDLVIMKAIVQERAITVVSGQLVVSYVKVEYWDPHFCDVVGRIRPNIE